MGWLMEDFNSFFLLKIKKEARVLLRFCGHGVQRGVQYQGNEPGEQRGG